MRRSRPGLARSYVSCLSILVQLMWPSTVPELDGKVNPAVTASWSRPGLVTKAQARRSTGGGHPPLQVPAPAVDGNWRGTGQLEHVYQWPVVAFRRPCADRQARALPVWSVQSDTPI